MYRGGPTTHIVHPPPSSSHSAHTDGSSEDFFFLAMAHWQLDQKDQAREWYAKAVEWMNQNQPDDEEFTRFRAEAAALLGIGRDESP